MTQEKIYIYIYIFFSIAAISGFKPQRKAYFQVFEREITADLTLLNPWGRLRAEWVLHRFFHPHGK